jgi:hypothetical protein
MVRGGATALEQLDRPARSLGHAREHDEEILSRHGA